MWHCVFVGEVDDGDEDDANVRTVFDDDYV